MSLLQKTLVGLFPKPTWWLTTILNSSYRESNVLFWLTLVASKYVVQIYTGRLNIHTRYNREKSLENKTLSINKFIEIIKKKRFSTVHHQCLSLHMKTTYLNCKLHSMYLKTVNITRTAEYHPISLSVVVSLIDSKILKKNCFLSH